LGELTGSQIGVLAILVVAFGLLVTERIRNDLVALLIVLALAASRILKPDEALAGFSSEAAIVVAAIFVLSAGLHLTGVSDTIGGWIGRLAGSSYTRVIAVVMPAVALLSAFTHHLTTTAVMLPVLLQISRDKQISPSKLLMPLSFAASLGTTITIIGAPAFLVASSVLQQAGRPGLGIFDIAPIGLALSAVGTVFTIVVGRFLLPDRGGGDDAGERFKLDSYFTELTILPDSPFLGKTVAEVENDDRHGLQVVRRVGDGRSGNGRGAPNEAPLRAGEVLLVRATPDELVGIRQERGVELHPVAQYDPEPTPVPLADGEDVADRLVQAVVAPGADLIGRTVGEVDFRHRYGALVVGLWRRDHHQLQTEIAQTRLRAGDVLVLQGDDDALARVDQDRAFLMLVPFHGEARARRRAPLAAAIMLATVVAAAFNFLSIEIAALAGAVAMVLAGCLTPRQAYQAVDTRIFVFIAGAIPIGAAMQKSGTADLLAGWLQQAVGGWPQVLVLLAIFGVVAVLTQFMSDAATTALFAPVAVALAQILGQAPEAYAVTVAMAAVAAFLTPIGHHGNLLVYGPGRYQFADFVRVGTPLTILVALVVAFMAPLLWHP
jgi:di/tricarboxylate transporter